MDSLNWSGSSHLAFSSSSSFCSLGTKLGSNRISSSSIRAVSWLLFNISLTYYVISQRWFWRGVGYDWYHTRAVGPIVISDWYHSRRSHDWYHSRRSHDWCQINIKQRARYLIRLKNTRYLKSLESSEWDFKMLIYVYNHIFTYLYIIWMDRSWNWHPLFCQT